MRYQIIEKDAKLTEQIFQAEYIIIMSFVDAKQNKNAE
jgi:hypothetical protein